MTRSLLLAALALTLASPAAAHLAPGEHGSFAAGVSHPLFGADHVLAMVVVGIWAALIGGRATWAVPLSFVGAMAVGYGLALAGTPLPLVEPVILASMIVFGALVALTLSMPLPAAMATAAFFGLFHGHAHGGELGEAGALAFGLGFVLATAALHAGGVVLGSALARARVETGLPARIVGGAAALAGLVIAFG